MSEERPDRPPRAPGETIVYIAPGMDAMPLADLLREEGVVLHGDRRFEELRSMIEGIQRQIDEARDAASGEAPAPEARPAPEQPTPSTPRRRT